LIIIFPTMAHLGFFLDFHPASGSKLSETPSTTRWSWVRRESANLGILIRTQKLLRH